jgi:hypothetical protein
VAPAVVFWFSGSVYEPLVVYHRTDGLREKCAGGVQLITALGGEWWVVSVECWLRVSEHSTSHQKAQSGSSHTIHHNFPMILAAQREVLSGHLQR